MDCKEVDIWTYCSIYLDEMKSDYVFRETEKNRQMISQILSTTFAPCSSHKVRNHHQRIESFEHCRRIYEFTPAGTPFLPKRACATLNRLWFVGSWFLNRVYTFHCLVQGHEIRSLVLGLKASATQPLLKRPLPHFPSPPPPPRSPGDWPICCINGSQ